MDSELVSVIVPTYKGWNYLSRAINSILKQTYSKIEIIVVDDNDCHSEDRKKTISVMKKYEKNYNIQYIKHEKNCNGSVARNTGMKIAKGEYITFLDDDDVFYPTRIEECVKKINTSMADIVYTGTVIIRDNFIVGYVNANRDGNLFSELFSNDNLIGTGSNIVFKRSAYEDVGGFDESLVRHQDYEYLLRMFSKGKIIVSIPKCLVVKATNGVNNIPDYNKMKKIKQYIFDKFASELMALDKDKYNNIMVFHHKELLKMTSSNDDEEYEINELKKYGFINIRNVKNKIILKKYLKFNWLNYLYCLFKEYKLILQYGPKLKEGLTILNN